MIERIARWVGFARFTVVDGEEAEIGSGDFSCQANTVFGMDDVARVDKQDRRAEEIRVLKKEGPELRKVDGVALVDGELGLIRFDIAEIGIDGSVEDDAVFDDELGFAAGSALEAPGAEVWIERIEIDQFALILGEHVGIDLQIMGAGDAFDAMHGGFLGENAGDAGGDTRPEVGFAVARKVA